MDKSLGRDCRGLESNKGETAYGGEWFASVNLAIFAGFPKKSAKFLVASAPFSVA